jgi:EPS-associated MarR family transcriptional regulator
MHALTHETRYRLLKYLAEHPDATQRELARELGISVGKTNYCLQALIKKGWVKVHNFRRSERKSAYAYVLTPRGIEEKLNVTHAFLSRMIDQYDVMRQEIDRLMSEVAEAKKSGAGAKR